MFFPHRRTAVLFQILVVTEYKHKLNLQSTNENSAVRVQKAERV